MRLILVEDNDQDRETCNNVLRDFNEDNKCSITIVESASADDAIQKLNNDDFDGAIIDLKLAAKGNEGNQVLADIKNRLNRIPVAIVTGTPDSAETDGIPLVGLYKKGETEYQEIITILWDIYQTGITKIMKGKGEIEKQLNQIFIKNILPQIYSVNSNEKTAWVLYAVSNPKQTEKSLLRHTVNHLIQILDNDQEKYYPEEMYISPPINGKIRPGCILKRDADNKYFIVMNPACDLVERDGICKADRALLVEILEFKDIEELKDFYNNNTPDMSLSNKEKKLLKQFRTNNKSLYYHYLPKTQLYREEAVINFRWISTHSENELKNNYQPFIQISPSFLKDIVSRFSSYYARQGQPELIMLEENNKS